MQKKFANTEFVNKNVAIRLKKVCKTRAKLGESDEKWRNAQNMDEN